MKEVLLYGLLVALVIGATLPVINGMNSTIRVEGDKIRTEVQTQIAAVTSAFGGGGGGGDDGGGGDGGGGT